MFSFLTGKKPDTAAEIKAPEPAAPAVEAPASATPATESPFTPPEAWKDEALKSPKPETKAGVLEVGPLDPDQTAALQGKIVEAVKTVFDPESPVDIYDLGLIYDIIVDSERRALINMTLTSPACPSAQQIPMEVQFKVKAIPEIEDARVEIVWEPAWTKERMSEAAKLTLGFF
jgi:FeS assembly SUF system protein